MNSSMHILALNWRCLRHPQAGGSELNLFEQARRWVKNGNTVTVFTSDPGRELAPQQNEVVDGIEVIRRGSRLTVYLYALWFVLRFGHRFDRILDVSNGIPFFTPLVTATPSVLLVHHVHDKQWNAEFPAPIAAIGRFIEYKVVPLLYHKSPVIAVSPTTRDALLELGFDQKQVEIVYNGVTAPVASDDLLFQGEHRIAYLGRLKRYKRIHLLVEAVAELQRDFPDIKLDLAGDGDARPELEALIKSLGLEDCVTVHGFVDDATKAQILRSATVFATPSMHEGWGLSVIEANVYGCPAIAYDVPGLRVAIRHGDTGLLASDDTAFKASLAAILSNTELRNQLSKGARQWAARFSWETSAASTLRILDTCKTKQQTYIAA